MIQSVSKAFTYCLAIELIGREAVQKRVGVEPSDDAFNARDRFERAAGRPLTIDDAVYQSEAPTGHRNLAIAHLLLAVSMLAEPIEPDIDLYFKQCSISGLQQPILPQSALHLRTSAKILFLPIKSSTFGPFGIHKPSCSLVV